jgi:hypothetical protein
MMLSVSLTAGGLWFRDRAGDEIRAPNTVGDTDSNGHGCDPNQSLAKVSIKPSVDGANVTVPSSVFLGQLLWMP